MQGKTLERTEHINLRCTPEQKKEIQRLASLAGVSVTAYIFGQLVGDKIGDAILKNPKK